MSLLMLVGLNAANLVGILRRTTQCLDLPCRQQDPSAMGELER